MKKLLASLLLMIGLSPAISGISPAIAADLPVKAAPYAPPNAVSWQGLYLDLYGLYAANTTGADIAMAGVDIARLGTSPHGPGIGGALGYNFQIGPGGLVFGPRVDLAYANLQGGGSLSNALSVSNATNWLGDIDVVLGLPLGPDGRLLGYVGGGFAFGGAKPNLQVATVSQGVNDTSTGWNLLAGLKYQLTPNWIIGIEGNYFQLGDRTISIPLTETAALTSTNKFHIWEQKLIIGYRF